MSEWWDIIYWQWYCSKYKRIPMANLRKIAEIMCKVGRNRGHT